ncbi:MAG TPA: M81 family metallopeptidase [Bryobacteraceae bacterium]|nr:M81 family metallopeptidase [Bryobacteraceae bacterium]
MPRVAVASLMHESNSFNPTTTPLDEFRIEATDLDLWAKGHTEVAGFLEAARGHGLEPIPIFAASATPSGPVEDHAYEALVQALLISLNSNGPYDGIYVALHGAMVATHIPHADCEILRRVRGRIGPELPLVVTHDFHANIPPEIALYCTALLTYQQNPHLDTKQRGARAARILAGTIAREVRPVQAIAKPPMIWNIVYQNTYAEPLRAVTEDSIELEQRSSVLSASVAGGYQYADVPHVGPSAVVVTDGDANLAQREAERLSGRLWDLRGDLQLNLPDPANAVAEAMRSPEYPVALFDAGDNVLGGSAGDSTFILHELLRQGAVGWVVAISDCEAVEEAKRVGVDGTFRMRVGGKRDALHGSPATIRGIVRSLHAGRYMEPEVRHGGSQFHQLGHSAVIEVDGSTPELQNLLLLTTLRSHPNSIHQIVSCGIYPERQKILVVKGTIAPRAAYERVARRIVLVDSPGATAVNPARFRYERAPARLYGIQ